MLMIYSVLKSIFNLSNFLGLNKEQINPTNANNKIVDKVEAKEKATIFSIEILNGENKIMYEASLVPRPEIEIGSKDTKLATALAIKK